RQTQGQIYQLTYSRCAQLSTISAIGLYIIFGIYGCENTIDRFNMLFRSSPSGHSQISHENILTRFRHLFRIMPMSLATHWQSNGVFDAEYESSGPLATRG